MSARTRLPELTPYARALELIARSVKPLGGETVPLEKSLGRFLVRSVKARHHAPRFEQSSMDGFAVLAGDLVQAGGLTPVTLRIVGEIPAGSRPTRRLQAGETIRVFTGGRLPTGADAVEIVEVVSVQGDQATFSNPVTPGQNVRQVGTEYRRGDVILPAGMQITPPAVGVLASLDATSVAVGRLPQVTVITMGDELVGPDEPLAPGKIRDANGPALKAALQSLGIKRVWHRRVGDRKTALQASLAAALRRSDLVITVGGASVGDHDHAETVGRRLGIEFLYTRVAVKPGKPNMFGLAPDGTPVFSLPGNPVSALVGFHQLVKPALRLMMGGGDLAPQAIPAVLGVTAARIPARLEWLRGNLEPSRDRILARPVSRQESHMLSGLALADLLAEIPRGQGEIPAGDIIKVYLLTWRW